MNAQNRDAINATIQKAIEALGPSIKVEAVDIGHPDGPQDFVFRRLPYIEMEELRLFAINDDGKFDKMLHKGHQSRLVARSLCDENGSPIYDALVIQAMPDKIVNKLYDAAAKINGLTTEAKEEIAKKSTKTAASVASSSS